MGKCENLILVLVVVVTLYFYALYCIVLYYLFKLVCTIWSEWSVCSATCNGIQHRTRHCQNVTHESDEVQAQPCNTLSCERYSTSATPTISPITTMSTIPSSSVPPTPGEMSWVSFFLLEN